VVFGAEKAERQLMWRYSEEELRTFVDLEKRTGSSERLTVSTLIVEDMETGLLWAPR
jgi:hypothetical protein